MAFGLLEIGLIETGLIGEVRQALSRGVAGSGFLLIEKYLSSRTFAASPLGKSLPFSWVGLPKLPRSSTV